MQPQSGVSSLQTGDMTEDNRNRSGNPHPNEATRWVKGQSGNPSGRPKLTQEEKTARARLKKLVAERADVPVKRLYAMLERHDAAVAEGKKGASNGVLSPDQELKICQYLNDWGNGKAVETMRTVRDEEDVNSPLDMSEEERASRISDLRTKLEGAPRDATLN